MQTAQQQSEATASEARRQSADRSEDLVGVVAAALIIVGIVWLILSGILPGHAGRHGSGFETPHAAREARR